MRAIEEIHHDLDFWGFLQVGHEGVVHVPVVGDVYLKTVVMTWAVMIVLGVFLVAATRKMSVDKPGKLQVMVEELFGFLRGLVFDNLDYKKGATLMCLVFTLFTFLLFSNLWGLVPTMMSPTADLNTTLALALMVFMLIQIAGMKFKGPGFLKHFVQPIPFLLPLTIIEELTKPVTLSLRLYGNIYAGEMLIAVLLALFPVVAQFCGGFIASVVWYLFSIFVGCIQAFLFTMLTIVYVSQVAADHH